MTQNSNKTTPQDATADIPGERLQNILAKRGIASRRHAAELIASGRVTVNDRVVLEPYFRADIQKDDICVNGQRVPRNVEPLRTIVIYKPRGLICSADNERGETVCDRIKSFGIHERLVPVGRLDKESEGLLLMSNDGELTNLMTHPRYGQTKTYIARVAGHMEPEKIETLRTRLIIDDYQINPVEVEILSVGRDHTHKIAFTLSEGRNRQIRKMCSLAHFVVLSLTRVRIGPIKICNMQPGEWRELSPVEVAQLKRMPLPTTTPPQHPRPNHR